MRLQTYGTLLRAGWVRKGTNTYVDPTRVPPRVLDRIAGNECIGASHYEAFLLGAGPQAVSFLPGARVENCVGIKAWASAVDRGECPYHLPKCSDVEQKDAALWVFPLRWEGLPQRRFDSMVAHGDESPSPEIRRQKFSVSLCALGDRLPGEEPVSARRDGIQGEASSTFESL